MSDITIFWVLGFMGITVAVNIFLINIWEATNELKKIRKVLEKIEKGIKIE